ncbi:hydantoinase/oxoprolinase [Cytidiella melzeri]|nr:hydantoinase/oxoprolinase [Cytidiella melzeri]
MLRIGVDVGGTNTDGVLIDASRTAEPNRGVLAHYKAPTTPNVSAGIELAVRQVLEASNVSSSSISCVSIGTTAFVNAVLEADSRRMEKVAVIRLCGPYTQQCPPFIDFPPALKVLTDGYVGYLDGGFEIDGREIVPLKEEQVIEQCKIIREKGLRNVVIVGIFSPLDNDGKQESRAKTIVERELGPKVNVVCSRDVGQVGLLERENASILNAAILNFARRTINGFKSAMRFLNLTCPLFLTQNDGTLTSAATAANLPIRTFASGPTNSMRGAAFLAGLDESNEAYRGKPIIVVDIGGTTTDVGVLLPSGFPRQAAAFIEIGGVRTNFSMADVQSIGLGGGSRVRVSAHDEELRVSIGPDSVGHNLTKEAKVFGGNVLTATDIVVAGGAARLGDAEQVADVEAMLVQKAQAAIKKLLEGIIDKMKTSPENVTILLVGGGSIVAPEALSGVSEIVRPPFFSVANAVGAAMAKVAGEVDTIQILQGRHIDDVINIIKDQAIQKSIRSGAREGQSMSIYICGRYVVTVLNSVTETVKIVEVANYPVQVPNIFSAGDLSTEAAIEELILLDDDNPAEDAWLDEAPKLALEQMQDSTSRVIDIEAYKPAIDDNRLWILSELDLDWIAEGCGVLGTGGGGSPYPPFLVARHLLREGKQIKVVDPEDVPETATFMRCMFMGSPSVSTERLQGGSEIPASLRALMKYMGLKDFAGVISDEIGGGNGLQPTILAAEMDRPVLDADLMGRAYPNAIILPSASDRYSVENILRTVTTEMGSRSGVSMAPLSRITCQTYGLPHSVSQAWRIGRAIAICRRKNDMKNIPAAILELQNGACLFVGKIVGVQREVRQGFTWGSVTIVPLQPDEEEDISGTSLGTSWGPEDQVVIPFQNENLYVVRKSPGVQDHVIVTVPDLITVLDSQSGSSIGTQEYRYGLRVTVIALAGHPKWTQTPEGLACGGPAAFGLHDVPFQPIADYREPQSVVQEFL